MLSLLRDLIAHKGHANAALLASVQRSEAAAADGEVMDLLHHILIANRFWIATVRREPFVESRHANVERTLPSLLDAFRRTQDEEAAWIADATEDECAATLTHPLIPGGACTVGAALTQVCLHSHAHRAQLAKLLRRHGGVPPQNDFILWLVERPSPDWSGAVRGPGS